MSHDAEYDEKVYEECCNSHQMIMTALNNHLNQKMDRLIKEVKETDFEEEVFFKIIYNVFVGPGKRLEIIFNMFNAIIKTKLEHLGVEIVTNMPYNIKLEYDVERCAESQNEITIIHFEGKYMILSPIIDVSKIQKYTRNAYNLFSKHHELVTPVGVMLTLYKKKSAIIKQQIEQDYLIYIGGLERVVNLWKAGSYADRLPIKLV